MGFLKDEIVPLWLVVALLLAVDHRVRCVEIDFDCREREDGYYGDPHDCNIYYKCEGDRPYQYSCGEGLHFNKENVSCEWPEEAHCTASEQGNDNETQNDGFTPSCHGKTEGSRFRDPTDCSVFYTCTNQRLFKDVCTHGLVYNPEDNACDFRENVDCGDNIVDGDPYDCKYKPLGYTIGVPEEDCKFYYECVFGTRLKRPCAEGTGFDNEEKVCVWLNDADCSPPSNSTESTNATDPNDTVTTTEDPNGGSKDETTTTTTTTTTSAPVWTTTTGDPKNPPSGETCKRRVCYYSNWSQYRPAGSWFFPQNIDPYLCTHVIFAFAKVSNGKIVNTEFNDQSSFEPGLYEKLNDQKKTNTKLKTLLAVGGRTNDLQAFHAMVKTKTNRQIFIDSAMPYLLENGFDGLDLSFVYPAHGKSPAEDKFHFTKLVEELRYSFNAFSDEMERERLLLTATVMARPSNASIAYEIQKICGQLDFVNLMTYDFHGAWDGRTGHNSPLYTDNADDFSVDRTVGFYIQNGCARDKLVVGTGLYGRTFQLKGEASGVGAPTKGVGSMGAATNRAGFLAYFEICKLASAPENTVSWDDTAKVPYLVIDKSVWVSYDNARSLQEKTRYVLEERLGGIMCWKMDLDDFNGQHCDNGTYPLWRSVNEDCSGK